MFFSKIRMDIFETRDDLISETRYVPIAASENTEHELVFNCAPDKRTLRLNKSCVKFSVKLPYFLLLDNDFPQKLFHELQFYMNNEVFMIIFYIFLFCFSFFNTTKEVIRTIYWLQIFSTVWWIKVGPTVRMHCR